MLCCDPGPAISHSGSYQHVWCQFPESARVTRKTTIAVATLLYRHSEWRLRRADTMHYRIPQHLLSSVFSSTSHRATNATSHNVATNPPAHICAHTATHTSTNNKGTNHVSDATSNNSALLLFSQLWRLRCY